MARGQHVHAVAQRTPAVGWCPPAESSLDEDDPTKNVPDYLVALAKSLEDDLVTDVHTQPMCGVATNMVDALDELSPSELVEAFESIDKLESDRPSALNHVVHHSGIVPAGTSLPLVKRDVIPPPPRRPLLARPVPTFAFAASLDAFTGKDFPFRAQADNEQAGASPKRHSLTSRAAISRTVASSIVALFAVFVLFVVGGRPLVVVQPVAHTPVTAHARAERSDTSGTARAPRRPVFSAPRPAPMFVAQPARVEPRRAPAPALVTKTTHVDPRRAPTRVAKAPAPARIIRTSPF